ncbi:hypothetical protein HYC85_003398 [Camellia sinensis]|uniref:Pentacotripeptide-repeat region of PRORP domain-containing protein n=1 Tax=Camellia sinensis TaxID=4442 RepID=A0A7J7IB92_CAMSI|nr:hypothetical protein HYC85_003398 [Camellia sinensis]
MLRDMDRHNVFPDVLTFNTLINAFCREGMAKDTGSVLEFMVQEELERINPHIAMHNVLIHRFCKDGKIEMENNLFGELSAKGLRPDILTYNICWWVDFASKDYWVKQNSCS